MLQQGTPWIRSNKSSRAGPWIWSSKSSQCGTGHPAVKQWPHHAAAAQQCSCVLVCCSQVLQKLPGECAQAVKVFDTGFMGRNFFMVMEVRHTPAASAGLCQHVSCQHAHSALGCVGLACAFGFQGGAWTSAGKTQAGHMCCRCACVRTDIRRCSYSDLVK